MTNHTGFNTGMYMYTGSKLTDWVLTVTIVGRMASRIPLYNYRLWKIAKCQNLEFPQIRFYLSHIYNIYH